MCASHQRYGCRATTRHTYEVCCRAARHTYLGGGGGGGGGRGGGEGGGGGGLGGGLRGRWGGVEMLRSQSCRLEGCGVGVLARYRPQPGTATCLPPTFQQNKVECGSSTSGGISSARPGSTTQCQLVCLSPAATRRDPAPRLWVCVGWGGVGGKTNLGGGGRGGGGGGGLGGGLHGGGVGFRLVMRAGWCTASSGAPWGPRWAGWRGWWAWR